MRTLRVVISVAGGVPFLTASMQGCGGNTEQACPTDATFADAATDRSTDDDVAFIDDGDTIDTGIDTGTSDRCLGGFVEARLVTLPMPGSLADPQLLCQIAPPATSNLSARVSFAQWDPMTSIAVGFVAVPANVLAQISGLPTITVTSASDPKLGMLQTFGMKKIAGGFQFFGKWPPLPMSQLGGSITVKASFTIACGDGGTQTVESSTPINYCYDDDDADRLEWVSAGDACTVCSIIAEMAPSPIISDLQSDGIPLARVIRIVVREIARAGRSVLLMAENDAGDGAEYEWRVSTGSLEAIAPDVVLWTLPDGLDRPFGQVAVMAETGAVVENFVWGGA